MRDSWAAESVAHPGTRLGALLSCVDSSVIRNGASADLKSLKSGKRGKIMPDLGKFPAAVIRHRARRRIDGNSDFRGES